MPENNDSQQPTPTALDPATGYADPTYDVEYQAFVNEMAKLCRCSHDQPCDGLLAGGVCDNLQWSSEREGWEGDDE